MLSKKLKVAGTIVAVVAALGLTAMAHAADDNKEVYTAFVVNMGGAAGMSGTLQINITRWSTNEERAMLLNTLKEKGHDEFIKALRNQKETGFVRAQGRLAQRTPFPSTRLYGAWQYEKDGKREVRLMTDRPISGREAAGGGRSLDYDLSVLIMEFPAGDKDADGTGTLHLALKLEYKDGKLHVGTLGQDDTRLTKIPRQK